MKKTEPDQPEWEVLPPEKEEGENKPAHRKLSKWLVVGLLLLYIISPIDVIPDALLGVGQLDDITVLVSVLYWLFASGKTKGK